MDTKEDNYEENPDLFSDSIIQMHNDLKNSHLYPEPKTKNTKSSQNTTTNNNNANNNFSNFVADISPGSLIPYDDDIEKKLNDLSSSSSSLNRHNNISLDHNYDLLEFNNIEVQTLQDEMEALNGKSVESKEIEKECPDKPSQVLFPENDGSLESLLLMLKVPPTQDVFQLIVQNAMGNDLPVSQKVFLSLESKNVHASDINFPSMAYNHLNNKSNESQYTSSGQNYSKGILSSENSNKIIVRDSSEINNDYNSFQNYRFGSEHDANANLYFPQNKEDRQRLQQYQKVKRRASNAFMDLVSQVPYWVDWDKINKGQEVFWKYGLPLWISITLYAMTKGAILPLPDPLDTPGNLLNSKEGKSPTENEDKKNFKKKKDQLLPSYVETSQIIIECMMPNSLRPGGVAWKSLVQIRCRHAQYRVDYVDTSFDLQDLHDYLSDGIKYYEKKEQRKKSRVKEHWVVDANGNIQSISKPEVKNDVKIVEFPYPKNDNINKNQLLLTSASQHDKEKQKIDEDTLEIEMLKGKINSKSDESKSKQNNIIDLYPTPSSSPIPNQQKSKNKSFKSTTQNNKDNESASVQKEVMSLPIELFDSIFPINQISLAKTILYLSIGSIKAMEKTFGISMTKEEQENYLSVWRYIAWVCGLEDKRGKNYGNKVITPKYAEIAINYFLEKDPLVNWDNELVYHAQAVIKSLSLTIPIIGVTSSMKAIVNEVSRKFTYFTSMPIPKEMKYSVSVNLSNNNAKIYSIPIISNFIQWLFGSKKKKENESENDNTSGTNKKQNNNNDNHSSNRKSRSREDSSSSVSISTQKYNKYKKKVEKNMSVIHGQKSYVASGIASTFLLFVRFINNIFGFSDIGVYLINKLNQSLIPKLIWIANNYQWVDFGRRKLTP